MNQLELSFGQLPAADASDDDLANFAAAQLVQMRDEAVNARVLSQSALQRGWGVGKACVALKERIGEERWEEWATEHVGQRAGVDYYPVYRCMRLARMNPEAPPLKGSAGFKQVQIAFGDEPPPKMTPRKTDRHNFINLMAAIGVIRRWWREGDGIKGMDNEAIRELWEDLKPIKEIHDNLGMRLESET